MRLYAITDRSRGQKPLLSLVEGWSNGGVHFIQLREKDLDPEALHALTQQTLAVIDRRRSKLLVNVSGMRSAASVLEAGADGVHLTGKPIPGFANSVRACRRDAIVSLPCHTLEDIEVATDEKVDLVLFSPVFEKVFGEAFPAQGLDGLRQACTAARGIPVFALGGVTARNASDCVAAGADGVAAIRLFAGEEWRRLAERN
ncbi:MAG: thiamine phosphate synthase [Acidobacteriaceae bacterium]